MNFNNNDVFIGVKNISGSVSNPFIGEIGGLRIISGNEHANEIYYDTYKRGVKSNNDILISSLEYNITESAGSTVLRDSSINNISGTIIGNASVSVSGTYVGGNTGYMSVPNSSSYQSTGRISFAVRFKPTTLGIAEQILMIKYHLGIASERSFELMYGEGDEKPNIAFYNSGGTTQLKIKSTVAVVVNTWNTLVITIDVSNPLNRKAYMVLNGVQVPFTEVVGTVANLSSIVVSTVGAFIGGWSTSTSSVYLRGEIDWFKIFTDDNILSVNQAINLQ